MVHVAGNETVGEVPEHVEEPGPAWTAEVLPSGGGEDVAAEVSDGDAALSDGLAGVDEVDGLASGGEEALEAVVFGEGRSDPFEVVAVRAEGGCMCAYVCIRGFVRSFRAGKKRENTFFWLRYTDRIVASNDDPKRCTRNSTGTYTAPQFVGTWVIQTIRTDLSSSSSKERRSARNASTSTVPRDVEGHTTTLAFLRAATSLMATKLASERRDTHTRDSMSGFG